MVYVDFLFTAVSKEAQAKRVGARNKHQWSHMWADTLEELHEMALRIGLKREWFQPHRVLPHYDLTPSRRAKAVKYGAKEISSYEYLRNLKRNQDI